jgi:hypothetical protein
MAPTPWHSRAGRGGAVHSIKSWHSALRIAYSLSRDAYDPFRLLFIA